MGAENTPNGGEGRAEFMRMIGDMDTCAEKRCELQDDLRKKAQVRAGFVTGSADYEKGEEPEVMLDKDKRFKAEGAVNEQGHLVKRYPERWFRGKAEAAKSFINHYHQLRTNFPSLCDPHKCMAMKDLIYFMSEMGNNENQFKYERWKSLVASKDLKMSDPMLIGPDGVYNILLAVQRLAKIVGGYDRFKDGELMQLRLGSDKSAELLGLGDGSLVGATKGLEDEMGLDLAGEAVEETKWEKLLEAMSKELPEEYVEKYGFAARRRNRVGMERISYSNVLNGRARDWVTVVINEKGFGIPRRKGGERSLKYFSSPEEAAKNAVTLLKHRHGEYLAAVAKRESGEKSDYREAVQSSMTTAEFKEKYSATIEPEGAHVSGLETAGRYVFRVGGEKIYGRLEGKTLILEKIEVGEKNGKWKELERVELGDDKNVFSSKVSVALDRYGA